MKTHLALTTVLLVVLLAMLLTASPGGQAAGPQAAPLDVVINEVAWGGTAASTADEWIELHNNTASAVDLTNWTLSDGEDILVTLSGAIPAHDFFLLERTDDNTVSDVAADQIYGGGLANTGERLELRDGASTLIDSADGSGGWPGGSGSPGFYSMERVDPEAADSAPNWASNDGLTRNGLDANNNPLNATPKARNSATPLPGADLRVDKEGPATVYAGDLITYTISFSNAGQLAAESSRLTDVLPALVDFVADTAPYARHEPVSGTLVWDLGTVATTTASAPITFTVTGRVSDAASGELSNVITVTSATTESQAADNHAAWVTLVGSPPVTPVVVIEALHFDGYESGETDEAVRVMNVSTATAELDNWRLSDGSSAALFPAGITLAPGEGIWCSKQATAFERQFGFKPDLETDDSDPAVPEMGGAWPGFANTGDECLLQDAGLETVDVLIFGGGNTATPGWSGLAVAPWTPSNTFAAEGQILYRKRDQATGLPVADTDTTTDWAQDPADQIDGRKVRYPGWDLDDFFFTQRVTETASLTVAVAPDNLYETISLLLTGAQASIQIETYSFRSKELTDILLDRLAHGVDVTLLLEGAPAVEGVTDQEKWIARQLDNAGAEVLFMINDSDSRVYDRYKYQHAKLIIVDGETVAIGSENPNTTSLPADDKANGTAGRRGVYLVTDAPGVVARAQAIFAADADPAHHVDVVGCAQALDLCAPPGGFAPQITPDWITYTVQFSDPLVVSAEMAFEVIQSPESSLRDRDSLIGMLNRAGPGDTILVQQFYEYRHWGPSGGTPETDPNPRLEAYLDAAERGAAVRILLDSHFDEGGDNAATIAYLKGIPGSQGWDLEIRRGDPTFLGLHNKMVLAHIDGQGYIHVGSINGGEGSNKINRELALRVQSDAAYDYLKTVFDYDWSQSIPPVYVPLVFKSYQAPQPAPHLLISEVYYAVSKEGEWVEIVNPTNSTVDLSSCKIGDAQDRLAFEGMYRFPFGTLLQPHQTLVIAASAVTFRSYYGHDPDFELYNTDPTVPTLLDYVLWGTGEWHLGNSGDEVLLLGENDIPLDVLVYGTGAYPGVTPHPGVSVYSHSLERYPYIFDTDDCSADFRDWPFPNPGDLP